MKITKLILATGITVLSAASVMAAEAKAADSPNNIFKESYRFSQALGKIQEKERKATQIEKNKASRLSSALYYAKKKFKTPDEREKYIERTKNNITSYESQLEAEKLKLKLLSIKNKDERNAEISKISRKINQLNNKATDASRPFALEKAKLRDSVQGYATKKIIFEDAISKLALQPEWSDRKSVNANFENTNASINWYKNDKTIAYISLTPIGSQYKHRRSRGKLQNKYDIYSSGSRSMNVQVGDFNVYFSLYRNAGNLNIKEVAPQMIDLDALAKIKLK